ncbi:MAG: hypothetical protein QXH30_02245 [Candidatus Bilamarchaeaceae archaeon]
MNTENPLPKRMSQRASKIPPPLFPKILQTEGIMEAPLKKLFLSTAARELGMSPKKFTGWMLKRRGTEEIGPERNLRIRVDLSFNFANRPIFVENRIGYNSLISEADFATIKKYFSLREKIRDGELVPISDGLTTRRKLPMACIKEFVGGRVRFGKDPATPFLVFESRHLSRFRVPIYEYNGNYFCKPEHAEPIAFAAVLWCGSRHSRARRVSDAFTEILRCTDPSAMPYGLGMKIWIFKAYSLDSGTGMHHVKAALFSAPTVQEFMLRPQDYLSSSI